MRECVRENRESKRENTERIEIRDGGEKESLGRRDQKKQTQDNDYIVLHQMFKVVAAL